MLVSQQLNEIHWNSLRVIAECGVTCYYTREMIGPPSPAEIKAVFITILFHHKQTTCFAVIECQFNIIKFLQPLYILHSVWWHLVKASSLP